MIMEAKMLRLSLSIEKMGGEWMTFFGKYLKFNFSVILFFFIIFYRSHTKQIKNTKIAFIHIDTNYLAYGKKGQKSKKYMGWHFKQ